MAPKTRPIAWSISDHAVKRYQQRVDRRLAPAGVLTLLRGLLPLATLLPERTESGQQRWLLPDGGAVVIAKVDEATRAHIAVTVLGPDQLHDHDAVDDVLEAFQRATAARSAPEPTPPPSRPRVVEVSSAMYPRGKTTAPVIAPAPAPPTTAGNEERASVKLDNLRRTYQGLLAAHQRLLDEIGRDLKVERLRGHADRMEADRELFRRLLRTAIVGLREVGVDHPGVAETLAGLEAQRPGITGDHFCYPERFDYPERRAATLAAEAAAASREAA
jgi:hypothetical protein